MCSICAILQIFLFFSMIWYCRVQSPAVYKRQDLRWCSFRWSIPLSIDYVWESSIDWDILTPSCSNCIWNRYCQNHLRILPYFQLFVGFDTVWIQSPAVSKRHDVRWRSIRWSIPSSTGYVWDSRIVGLSRLLHAHIANEIDTSKIIAEFCRISYCLYVLIRSKTISCHVRTTRCTMIWFR